VLPYIYQLWDRPVHMDKIVEDRHDLFTYEGKRVNRKFIKG